MTSNRNFNFACYEIFLSKWYLRTTGKIKMIKRGEKCNFLKGCGSVEITEHQFCLTCLHLEYPIGGRDPCDPANQTQDPDYSGV